MLKHRYKTKEDVPEKFRDLYTQRKDSEGEDGWELTEVEGLKSQADTDRLRKSLQSEREEHEKTREASKKALADSATLADKLKSLETDPKKTNQNEMVLDNERLKRENEALKEKSTKTEEELGSIRGQVTLDKVKSHLRKAWKSVIRDDALDDVIEQEAGQFVIVDGEILTKTGLPDNKSGMEPKAYGERLVKSRSYLVPPSQSGGAQGGTGKGEHKSDDDKPANFEDMIPEIGGTKK